MANRCLMGYLMLMCRTMPNRILDGFNENHGSDDEWNDFIQHLENTMEENILGASDEDEMDVEEQAAMDQGTNSNQSGFLGFQVNGNHGHNVFGNGHENPPALVMPSVAIQNGPVMPSDAIQNGPVMPSVAIQNCPVMPNGFNHQQDDTIGDNENDGSDDEWQDFIKHLENTMEVHIPGEEAETDLDIEAGSDEDEIVVDDEEELLDPEEQAAMDQGANDGSDDEWQDFIKHLENTMEEHIPGEEAEIDLDIEAGSDEDEIVVDDEEELLDPEEQADMDESGEDDTD